MKPVLRRQAARRDVAQAVIHYAGEGGLKLAARFIESLDHASRAIARWPGLGSPRHGEELEFPGLRTRPMKRFPYLIFYIEHDEHVEIWRVLHAHSDIAAKFRAAQLSEPGANGRD